MTRAWLYLAALGIYFFSITAQAAITIGQAREVRDRAIVYLLDAQKTDGSWGDDPLFKVRETATAIEALQKHGFGGVAVERALTWLANTTPLSTDSAARALKVLWANGIEARTVHASLLSFASKKGTANTDRVMYWGGADRWTVNVLDTCLVLAAFNEKAKYVSPMGYEPGPGEPISRVVYDELIATLEERMNYYDVYDPQLETNTLRYVGWTYDLFNMPFPQSSAVVVDVLPTTCAALALIESDAPEEIKDKARQSLEATQRYQWGGSGSTPIYMGKAKTDLDSTASNTDLALPTGIENAVLNIELDTLEGTDDDGAVAYGTTGKTSGKHVFQVKLYAPTTAAAIGVFYPIVVGSFAGKNIAYTSGGELLHGEITLGDGATGYAAGDTITIAVDADARTFSAFNNAGALEFQYSYATLGITRAYPLIVIGGSSGKRAKAIFLPNLSTLKGDAANLKAEGYQPWGCDIDTNCNPGGFINTVWSTNWLSATDPEDQASWDQVDINKIRQGFKETQLSNGSWEGGAFVTSLVLKVVTPTIPEGDADRDGIPDFGESLLGLNPNTPDYDWLEDHKHTAESSYLKILTSGPFVLTVQQAGAKSIRLLSALPEGLVFDSETATISGELIDNQVVFVSYEVTNEAGDKVVQSFQLKAVNAQSDDDGDGMPAIFESDHGLDLTLNDAALDKDFDGLSNKLEFDLGSKPDNDDSDNDGFKDGCEHKYFTVLSSEIGSGDPDKDGLPNSEECFHGTDPTLFDTDGDAFSDKEEIEKGRNPLFNENLNLMQFLDGVLGQ